MTVILAAAGVVAPARWNRPACAAPGTDLGLFFGPDSETGTDRKAREREAAKVCAGCPVRIQCLEHALTADERHGVWGGFGETGLAGLRRSRTCKARAAGRLAAIEAAGEKPCTQCSPRKPLPLARFGRNRGGYQAWCLECTNSHRRKAA